MCAAPRNGFIYHCFVSEPCTSVQYVGMGFESGKMEEGGGCIYPSGKDGGISGREEDMLKTSLVD